MQHPDEGTIHAWIDGALAPAEAAELETHISSCAGCRDAVVEARGLIAASSRIVSALDAVPAGVIPRRAPAARPWYASTQLRAAAAVVFVAGASMLLISREEEKTLSELSQRAVSTPAAEVAIPDAIPQAEQNAANAVKGAAPKTKEVEAKGSAGSDLRAQPSRDEAARVGSTAGEGNAVADAATTSAVAQTAAPAPALPTPPPPTPDTSRLTANKSIAVSPVVVTGVVSGTQEVTDDLRILGVDSTSGRRVTRYRIASGAEIVLTEAAPSGRGATARERRFDAARVPAAAPPPPARAVAVSPATGQATIRAEAAMQLPLETLTWTDMQSGKVYTLSGRVSKATLEQVKAKLGIATR